MALDRQAVEKKDFPIARRGYDPDAVDAHLTGLASELETLQHELDAARSAAVGAPAPPPVRASGTASLALAASEQVRVIVEAAESSAAEIEQSAADDAARIRGEADADARQTRDDAVARSQDHVGAVGAATQQMLQRVDAMESELGALLESLRTGSNRLTADLSLLQGSMGELYGPAGPPSTDRPATGSVPVPPIADPVGGTDEIIAVGEADDDEDDIDDDELHEAAAAEAMAILAGDEPIAEVPSEPEPLPPVPAEPEAPAPQARRSPPADRPAPVPAAGGDVEGARLIALNMALNGQSRDETGRYLADNFDLADRDGLLDEVYATVEG